MNMDVHELNDAMQARLRLTSTTTTSVCRWYATSGTCRTGKACRLPHLRPTDDVQTHASFDGRQWSLSSTEDEEQTGQQAWRFSVASYNILADKYARHYRSYLYHEVPATWLEWQHRRAAILSELAFLLPDVICLQEVDRYEDLEAELQQLGYSGIFLQRDGGRRDGCATFWRHSLLQPAVVREVRFSYHDLKDNVALLVLFEPCTGTAQHSMAAVATAAAAAQDAGQQRQQQGSSSSSRVQGGVDAHSSSHPQQQQQQQQYGESPKPSSSWGQWLPSSWLWSSSGSNSSSNHTRSSSVVLCPVQPSPTSVAGQHGCVYQIPVPQQQQPQQQQQGSLGAGDPSPNTPTAAAAAAAGGQATAAAYSSSPSPSSSFNSSRGPRYKVKGHRRSGSGGSSSSRRQSLDRPMQGEWGVSAVSNGNQQLQQQQAPDWVQCAVLVANTHIIFTPEKGDVKLGQARLLTQEVAHMAQWYLEQQQQQQQQQPQQQQPPEAVSVAGTDSSAEEAAASNNSSSTAATAASMQAVAAILTGDYNATPHSPLYAYLSEGLLDLQTVNRRNVSHMVGGGSHHHHHKGYRGFRRANRRRSLEQQQQQLEQQQQQELAEASCQPLQEQQQQQQGSPQPVNAAVRAGGSQLAAAFASSAAAAAAATGAGVSASTQGLAAAVSSSPGSTTTATAVQQSGVGIPLPQQQQQQQYQRQDSSGSSAVYGSSPPVPPAASSPSRRGSTGVPQGGRQYKWSDKEVRRAAGMSYDELVEASMSLLSESESDSPVDSCDMQVQWAAAAFATAAAGGSGAAAAATAAADAAAAVAASKGAPAGSGAAAAGGSSNSGNGNLGNGLLGAMQQRLRSQAGGEPLLLQHGLKLQSSYKNVLGREPEYTSSHSQFMDTCDYIWYTSTPLCSSSQSNSGGSSGSSSRREGAAKQQQCSSGSSARQPPPVLPQQQQQQQYELRPVAVLQPPDGMLLNKGLPSKSLGSDHVCLLTDFELVVRQPLAK